MGELLVAKLQVSFNLKLKAKLNIPTFYSLKWITCKEYVIAAHYESQSVVYGPTGIYRTLWTSLFTNKES